MGSDPVPEERRGFKTPVEVAVRGAAQQSACPLAAQLQLKSVQFRNRWWKEQGCEIRAFGLRAALNDPCYVRADNDHGRPMEARHQVTAGNRAGIAWAGSRVGPACRLQQLECPDRRALANEVAIALADKSRATCTRLILLRSCKPSQAESRKRT